MAVEFSIVVPCYRIGQRRWLVEQCLASIARQTFTAYELLLVDDGSPDDTVAVLERVVAAHRGLASRSRIITLPENAGVCAARNAGIDAARGAYIAYLDYDDLWQSTYLAQMHEAIRQHPAAQVYLMRTDFMRTMGARLRVRDSGAIGHLNSMADGEFKAWHLLHNFPVGMGSAVVVARRLYGEQPDLKFDLALSRTTAEDVLFGFQLLARGIRPVYVDEPLCVHRRIMEMVSRGFGAFLRVDEREVNDYIGRRASDEVRRAAIAERPDLAAALIAQQSRLNLEFDLKREFRKPGRWFGLRACLRHPRGLKTVIRLHGTALLLNTPLEFLLRHYFFRVGGDDACARKRVQTLLDAVTQVPGSEPRTSVTGDGGEPVSRPS
jgi:glycosyltransferase involved in cell wall biosynthesis